MPTGALTKAGAELCLNRAFRGTGTPPVSLYLGLATVAVAADNTLASISEVITAGYSREAVSFGAPTGTNPVAIANTSVVTFGAFSADPPAIGFAFLTNAASGTSGTIYGRWTDAIEDAALNESLEVPIGSLILALATSEASL